MRRRIIAGVIVTAALATAGIAYADNQPADPSVAVVKAAATGAPAPAAAGGKAGVLRGAIHGDLLVRGQDGTTRTVTFDRGKVTQVSDGSITIERPDGVSVTDGLTGQTVFNGTPRDKLTAGTPTIVVSEGHTATHVVTRGAGAQAAAKACAATPADGSGAAAGNGAAAGVGSAPSTAGKGGQLRARIKERLCQRLEQRQQRRAGKGLPGGKGVVGGQGAGSGQGPAAGQGGGAGQGPAAKPSSVVDDGLKTIVS
jgi:hypothetical protein